MSGEWGHVRIAVHRSNSFLHDMSDCSADVDDDCQIGVTDLLLPLGNRG